MNSGQVHLKRLRRITLLFSIVAGALFAVRWNALVNQEYFIYRGRLKLRPHEKAELALPFIVAAFYIYTLWGKPLKFVHKYLRAVIVLGFAIGWLYTTIGVMTGHIINRYETGFVVSPKAASNVGKATLAWSLAQSLGS